ncbi:MAG: 30S ribosomal protein S20 [Chloroflexi bacterium]|nr:30S ribosomal protein S20 [Chloroflexota bacterium]
MANTKSALKAARQAQKNYLRNRVVLSSTRTYVKKARLALANATAQEAQEAVQRAMAALDRAAQKGVIHPNNAARHKSRLIKAYNHKLTTGDAA